MSKKIFGKLLKQMNSGKVVIFTKNNEELTFILDQKIIDEFLAALKNNEGFLFKDLDGTNCFVPFHSINYVVVL